MKVLRVFSIIVFSFVSAITPSLAQQANTTIYIINALRPHSPTRSLRPPVISLEDMRILQMIKYSRGPISANERNSFASMATRSVLPTLDLEVFFAFNSDQLQPAAVNILVKLGQAITNPALESSSFIIAGHTDAVGTREYNQNLSERRATAVKKFLVEKFNIKPSRLSVAGYGQESLKNKADPYSAENRRVQVLNLGQTSTNAVSIEIDPNDPLTPLNGSWLTINPPGSNINFYKVGLGQRAASLPMGQASVRVSDGSAGSNLKVSGEGFNCFYFVGFVSESEMTWQIKQGDPVCIPSAHFKKAM